MSRPSFPVLVLVVGFSFSLAANLLACWPGGPVRILGGALASVALPGSIHLWARVPAAARPQRWLRDTVMAGITALAALTTFFHASTLLIARGERPLLAAAYPVLTELLVVMAVLAHRGGAARAATLKRRTRRVSTSHPDASALPHRAITTPKLKAAGSVTADAVSEHRGARVDRVAWLRGQPERSWTESVQAVETKFGVSRSTAKRVVAAATARAS